MANNVSGFKSAVVTAITSNFDATTQTKVGNRFLVAYAPAWSAYLAGGGTDTAGNRRNFVVDRVFDYLNEVYRNESNKENVAALPPAETIT